MRVSRRWPLLLLLLLTISTHGRNSDSTDDLLITNITQVKSDDLDKYVTTDKETKRSESYSKSDKIEQRELDDAVEYGLKAMQELLQVKEPKWYEMGLVLDEGDPASHVAKFGQPIKKAIELSNFGYAAVEAAKKIAERLTNSSYPENVSRQATNFFDTKLLQDECPLRGLPRCPTASRRYRTADGTCNNFNRPWRGSSLLPMQRFLPPAYHDRIQEPRRSVTNRPLPSPRAISTRIHRDKNLEVPSVTLMFMQWGQLLDHDLVSTVKSRSFNGSIPRCCHRGGVEFLPADLTHPSCLPILVPEDDWFLVPFGIRCIEFIRSAPSTRIDCDLGYREQINQATSFLDASTIYGSDIETSDSMRTFRNGKLFYGRAQDKESLQPPDPPGGELCRSGAITSDCLQQGDGRISEQPGLTAIHTVWVRYHNRVATILSQINRHWSDEKVYQETRRLVVALFQHITYREFLPIVLGREVLDLFGLTLEKKGYYQGFDKRVNPSVANSFGAAAFRFGHSMVQNSFVRFDSQHRPLFNNVTLHEEQENFENIWSAGSLDRLLLGFCNQPSQRRDEFISVELTNHLFQSRGFPFGMDLAAINIQRGRDHGIPSYTSWREPCGLSPIKNWKDLGRIMNPDTVDRLQSLYEHIHDIDLYTGGLAEKPVRGGIVGPTFACIIAQQFLNLRKGDRFWYENGGFESSFTPAQLQQIRHVTFAHILCHTLTEIETIQPFVFLSPDNFQNKRVSCDSSLLLDFDLSPWIEQDLNEIGGLGRDARDVKKRRKLKRTSTTRKPKPKDGAGVTPVKVKVKDVTTHTVKVQTKQTYNTNGYVPVDVPQRPTFDPYNDRRTTLRDVTYLFGLVSRTTPIPQTQKPFQVNIKIQYYPPTFKPSTKKRRTRRPNDSYESTRPYYETTTRTNVYSDDFSVYRPTYVVPPPTNDFYGSKYTDLDYTTTRRPYDHRLTSNNYVYASKSPQSYFNLNRRPQYDIDDKHDKLYSDVYSNNPNYGYDGDDVPKPMRLYSTGHIEKLSTDNEHDKLDFYSSKKREPTKFVKISSVRGEEYLDPSGATVHLHVAQREGDLELGNDAAAEDDVRLVDLEVVPGDGKWLVYNATDETMEPIDIPDVNVNISSTDELPRPMNETFFRTNSTLVPNRNTTDLT